MGELARARALSAGFDQCAWPEFDVPVLSCELELVGASWWVRVGVVRVDDVPVQSWCELVRACPGLVVLGWWWLRA